MMTILNNIEDDRGGGDSQDDDNILDDVDIIDDNENDNTQRSLLHHGSSKQNTVNNNNIGNSNEYIKLEQDEYHTSSLIENDNNNNTSLDSEDITLREKVDNHVDDLLLVHPPAETAALAEEEDHFYRRPFAEDLLANDKSITNRVQSVERGMNHVSSFRDIAGMNLSKSMEIRQNIILSGGLQNTAPLAADLDDNIQLLVDDCGEEEFEDILLERDNIADHCQLESKKMPPVSPFKQLLAMKLKSISSHIETPMATLMSGVDVIPVHQKEKYLTFPSSQLTATLASNGKMSPNQFLTSSIPLSSSSSSMLSASPASLSSSPFKHAKPNLINNPHTHSPSTSTPNLANIHQQNFTSMPNLLYSQSNSIRTPTSTSSDSISTISMTPSQLTSSSVSTSAPTSAASSVTSTSSTSSTISPSILQSNHQHQTYIITPIRKTTSLQYEQSNITRPVLSSETNKIGWKLIVLLACSVFFSVSNLYYIQPLLNMIGEEFKHGPAVMSLVTMAVQGGYAFGLLFISTLGDIISKKKLMLVLSAFTCVSLIGVALSYHIAQMIIFQFIVGCSTIIPHIAIPLAIDLSTPDERKSIIGILMSSLFVGLLGARVISGVLAEFIGWRSVYYLASGIIFTISLLLFISLPYIPRSQNPIPYNQLLKSIFNLFKLEPHLKQTCFIGSMVFATFSILWTTLSFQLSEKPFSYSSVYIGLFGLIGMAGAIAAPIAGRLSSRLSVSMLIVVSLMICVAGYGILLIFGNHLLAIISGIFVLDLGVQACHITNQSRNHQITQIRAEIDGSTSNVSSYINAAYMASYFIGGAFGSGICGVVFEQAGWKGSSIVAMVLLGVALSAHLSLYQAPISIDEINNNNNNEIEIEQYPNHHPINMENQYHELQEEQ